MLRVAMALEPADEAREQRGSMRIVFHGASKLMLRHVFGLLRGRLFKDFSLTDDMALTIINGKCYRTIAVRFDQPDFYRLSLGEWPIIIKHLMEQAFRCKVTFFENYEKFLNT